MAPNHFFNRRSLIVMALWLNALFPASAAELSMTVDGMEIYYGVVPAEVIRKQTEKHDPKMHPGRWLRTGSHHLTVALFDAKTGQRITDARVDATVTPLGLAATKRRLEPMLIDQVTSYGAFFNFPPSSSPFRIVLNITRKNPPVRSVAEFEYRPANNP
ncbi:MAG: hypothetical protein GZ085_08175 [Sulfuriferula multivorans]|uniref:DUF4426 domain-containing protein n=1 Tax=Sulfuriferula multivorans TaxID=1559896 RepID=A0A7C9KAE4_9PROT|nr:hypothetical protein [Sulfuriferula multivorans]